jgi:translation initiation factor 5
MRHKLTNFILNHPPAGAVSGAGGKKRGKRGKGGKSKDQTPNDSGEDEEGSGDELHKQIMEEAKQLREAQSKDDDWSVDMSEEAQKRRQAELLKGVEQLNLGSSKIKKSKKKVESDDDYEFAEEDPLDTLVDFVRNRPKATVEEILGEVKESRIPIHLATHVLAQALILPESLVADLKKHAPLFTKLNSNARAHKYFLGGLERMVATADIYKKVPVMLKVIYELDIVDEEAILAWGEKPTKKFTGKKKTSQLVRDAAEPFLTWLKSEGDDEESDDE